MARGGARVRSGPAPTPGSIRQGRLLERGGVVHLPAAGRDGDAPAWPLPGRRNKWETERWAIEWRRPQAIMWARLGLELQVGIYVRTLRLALSPKAPVTLLSRVGTMQNDLGLTADSMKRLGWVIEAAAPEAADAAPPREEGSSAKSRLKVLTGGVDAVAS